MSVTGWLLGTMTLLGVAQAIAGWIAVWRFARQPPFAAASLPAVSVLKPVCGDEIRLEQAITTFCEQDYPRLQLVIGAQDPADPAIATARRVAARFADRDIAIVVDATPHGLNRKVANLINMLPAARHDVLILSDSDLHVRPDYVRQVVSALARDGIGLVTTIGSGEAACPGIAARLGEMHLSHIFLPGALLAVALGRQDCLGGTMALRRETLAQIGGLGALVDHVADDNVLGSLVRRLGLRIAIANTLPVMTVQERTLRALWQHELRWARTIRALAPAAFATSVLQYPLFWSLLWVLASGGAWPALLGFAAAWAARAAIAAGIDATLRAKRARPARPAPFWLLPLRDVLSVAEVAASYWDNQVVWRGQSMRANAGVSYAATIPTLVESAASKKARGFHPLDP